MGDVFLQLFNTGITACWVILAVLLLRLLLNKAPKWIRLPLWAIVGVRLVIPFSIESKLSLIPSTDTICADYNSTPIINSGIHMLDAPVNSYIRDSYSEGVTVAAGTFNNTASVCAVIWFVGMLLMLAYCIFSYAKLRHSVATAVLLKDNIYQSENVTSPFVLGVFKARIYIPFDIDERELLYVVAHEKSHIKHFDNLIKMFAFMILSVYWFNPIIWLAYILFCRDIEFICDERVVKNFNSHQKADYSQALLSLSTNKKVISVSPIAFGEEGVKHRIKSVLNYKKPAFWIVIIAIVICAVTAICLLTNPVSYHNTVDGNSDTKIDEVISEAIINDNVGRYYSGECPAEGHIIFGTEEKNDNLLVYALVSYSNYGFENGNFVEVSGMSSAALFELKATDDSYECIHITYPEDGEYYAKSLEKMFPKKYVTMLNNTDNESLRKQTEQYAKVYLDKIGRKAKIGAMSDFSDEYTLLTDVGVSVEVSNSLTQIQKNIDSYPYWLGTREEIENGIRYVYEMQYNKEKNLITYSKYAYGAGAAEEIIFVDSLTGEITYSSDLS